MVGDRHAGRTKGKAVEDKALLELTATCAGFLNWPASLPGCPHLSRKTPYCYILSLSFSADSQ